MLVTHVQHRQMGLTPSVAFAWYNPGTMEAAWVLASDQRCCTVVSLQGLMSGSMTGSGAIQPCTVQQRLGPRMPYGCCLHMLALRSTLATTEREGPCACVGAWSSGSRACTICVQDSTCNKPVIQPTTDFSARSQQSGG